MGNASKKFAKRTRIQRYRENATKFENFSRTLLNQLADLAVVLREYAIEENWALSSDEGKTQLLWTGPGDGPERAQKVMTKFGLPWKEEKKPLNIAEGLKKEINDDANNDDPVLGDGSKDGGVVHKLGLLRESTGDEESGGTEDGKDKGDGTAKESGPKSGGDLPPEGEASPRAERSEPEGDRGANA